MRRQLIQQIASAHIALLVLANPAGAQLNEGALDRLQVLVGTWQGAGDGKWGSSSAEREYAWVFGGVFIRGSGRSVYPKQDRNKAGEIHESIDMYSYDGQRNTIVLRQFDNESFVTTYYLNLKASTADAFVFEAEHLENVPLGWRARVTFDFKGSDEFHEHFDLDTAKGSYDRYLTTRFRRVSTKPREIQ